jgi:hypothetical protein
VATGEAAVEAHAAEAHTEVAHLALRRRAGGGWVSRTDLLQETLELVAGHAPLELEPADPHSASRADHSHSRRSRSDCRP